MNDVRVCAGDLERLIAAVGLNVRNPFLCRRRDEVPPAWLDRVKIKTYGYSEDDDSGRSATATGQGQGGNGKSFSTEADGEDHGTEKPGSGVVNAPLPNIPEPDRYPDSDAQQQCPDSDTKDPRGKAR